MAILKLAKKLIDEAKDAGRRYKISNFFIK